MELRRALDGTNPTPKSINECENALIEEYADVIVCISALNCSPEWYEDGIAATWGALIQNLRCDADLADEQVQKIIRIGDRYWEMVGRFKNEDMTPDEFADYITAKSEQVEKELRERWS